MKKLDSTYKGLHSSMYYNGTHYLVMNSLNFTLLYFFNTLLSF